MVQPLSQAYVDTTADREPARPSHAASELEDGVEPGEERSSWRMMTVRVVATLVVVLLVALGLHKLDLPTLRGALASAAVGPLVLAAFLSFAMLVAKAGYWRMIISPVARVPLRKMLWYAVSASGASVVLPMRGGEAVRIYWLRKRHGVPLSVIGAALGFEKVSDVTSLVLLALPLPWLFPKEAWLGRFQVIASVVLVAIVVAFFVAQRAKHSLPWVAKLRIFDTMRAPLSAYACVLASWVADATLILVVMHSVGLPMQVGAALLVLLAANLAIAIPTAPGNVGALELGVAFALTRLGVPDERAAAFAILYHGIQLATLLSAWCIGAGIEALSAPLARSLRRA